MSVREATIGAVREDGNLARGSAIPVEPGRVQRFDLAPVSSVEVEFAD